MLGTNTKPNQVLAASVINALVMEFSGTGKSSMIGLSLAGHAEAKLYFETNELPGIFSLGLVLTQTNQGKNKLIATFLNLVSLEFFQVFEFSTTNVE